MWIKNKFKFLACFNFLFTPNEHSRLSKTHQLKTLRKISTCKYFKTVCGEIQLEKYLSAKNADLFRGEMHTKSSKLQNKQTLYNTKPQ